MTRLLSALLAVIRFLPRLLFPAFAAVVVGMLRPFAKKDVACLRQNVHRIYGLPPATHFSKMFEKQVFRHQVLCALETLRAIQDPAAIEVVGFDELKLRVAGAESAGKGLVVVTAHMGSWELCAYYIAKAATRRFHVLAKPSRQPKLTAFLNGLRERMGVGVLWTDRKTLLREMLTALRSSEAVGFVMDQKPEGRKGPEVDFFGQQTEFVSGPASMAIKTQAAVISIFCVREGPFRYRILSSDLAAAEHGESDEIAFTSRMAREIESVVRLYPEQWTWNYKRWKFS